MLDALALPLTDTYPTPSSESLTSGLRRARQGTVLYSVHRAMPEVIYDTGACSSLDVQYPRVSGLQVEAGGQELLETVSSAALDPATMPTGRRAPRTAKVVASPVGRICGCSMLGAHPY